MLLFCTRLLSFRVPRVDVLIVVLPKPTPANVVVLALPETLRFLIVSFVVGSAVVTVWPQMTALDVPVPVLLIVRSRVEPPEFEITEPPDESVFVRPVQFSLRGNIDDELHPQFYTIQVFLGDQMITEQQNIRLDLLIDDFTKQSFEGEVDVP